jgi:hypothetical protein
MKLTHKRQIVEVEAAKLLAAEPNISKAAHKLGLNRSTLHRWRLDPAFLQRIEAAKRQQEPARAPADAEAVQGPEESSHLELCQEASAWRQGILSEFALSEAEKALLERAAVALHRAITAGKLVDSLIQDGEPHPALKIELDQTNLFRQLVRQLNFPAPSTSSTNENVIPMRNKA